MWVTVILSILCVTLYLFYKSRRRSHDFSKVYNINGPKPHWFYGNLQEVTPELPLPTLINKWTKQYGEVYVYYEGPDPTVVISNPDLVQEAYIKQFSTFHGRKRFPLQDDPNKSKQISMVMAEGERWKRLRTTINPAFTDTKMRGMFPLIKVSVDEIMDSFKKASEDEKPVDVNEYIKRMTLDVIAECAFGIHLDTQNSPNNQIFHHLKYFFDVQLVKGSWLLHLAQAMPELRYVFRPLQYLIVKLLPAQNRHLSLLKGMTDVVNLRKHNPENRRQDILQLLLDAETENISPSNGMKKSKALTIEEIREQAMLFLCAGYETSSAALGYLLYALSMHEHAQKRLQAEVDDLYEELGDETETSYDRLGTLSYMNNVINETLRYYPIAPSVIGRRCSKTIKLDKYTIPEGTNILADMYALHFNPELWGPTDPNIFDPDRFEGNPKRHPAAWIPFGIGPRFCVGQRFAMMEIRAALMRIVREFSIHRCEETMVPLQIKYGPTVTPKGELLVKLEPRAHAN